MRNPNLTFVRDAIKISDMKMPAPFEQSLNDIDRIDTAAQNLQHEAGFPALAEAWTNAILENRDPATDPHIIRALTSNALTTGGDITYAAHIVIEKRLTEQLTKMTDTILNGWAKTVTTASNTMTDAHEILGTIPLEDQTSIATLGPRALEAAIDARTANHKVKVIAQGWNALASLTRFATNTTELATRIADLDLNTWEKVRRTKEPWVIIQAGATLTLATNRDDIATRLARLDRQREERAARQLRVDEAARGRRAS